MYIQITTRCNMTCAHCGFNCTQNGEDMSIKTFKNALDYEDESIIIGGGEPTIHPEFKEILFDAIANSEYVWLATNGSMTEISLLLAKLAKKGVIGCALSIDDFHDPIDDEVIEAFELGKNKDGREIRNVSDRVIKAGRSKVSEVWVKEDECFCEELIVKPNGDVYSCGCEYGVCFGNVNTRVEIPEDYEYQCLRHNLVTEE